MGAADRSTRNQTLSTGRNRRGGTGVRRARVAGAVLSHRRNLSPCGSVNRRVERAKSLFEFGLWKIGPSRIGSYIDNREVGMIFTDALDLLEIIQLIGSDSEKAVIRERAVD